MLAGVGRPAQACTQVQAQVVRFRNSAPGARPGAQLLSDDLASVGLGTSWDLDTGAFGPPGTPEPASC